MAVILVPARFVPGVVEECGRKGVRRAVIETAGFREYSDAGRALEDQVVAIAEQYGIRFIGPNCIGVINMENGFCVPFPRLTPFFKRGEGSVISQSGGVGLSIMNHMAAEGIGLNKFASAGNMLNINAEDLLEYYIEDEGTKIICMYLEDISDGREFIHVCREIFWEKKKPMLAIKAGRSIEGARAASSHTGSLAGSDAVYEALLLQSGVQRVATVEELFDLAEARVG